MNLIPVGIIMNGVTGRMGTRQHLIRSILAIQKQGGVKVSDREAIWPEPILVGRNLKKLKDLARAHNIEAYSTNLDTVLSDSKYSVYFDSQATSLRVPAMLKAIEAGKDVYCEKPVADSLEGAIRLYQAADRAGVKNGVVQDKLFLPGIQKFMEIKKSGILGEILAVRGEFGYWVFTGHNPSQPPQRPSWNYQKEKGGGIILDMHCHWRYVLDNMISPLKSVFALAATHIKERIDEDGHPYNCTADDSVYALFQTIDNVICQFNSSWCTRVRRDDLLTIQVDGTQGSAIVGLQRCWVQTIKDAPVIVWNPDVSTPVNYLKQWREVHPGRHYENAFKKQWELFLRHVVLDEPFPWSLREGAKGVQLAEKSMESHQSGTWVTLDELP